MCINRDAERDKYSVLRVEKLQLVFFFLLCFVFNILFYCVDFSNSSFQAFVGEAHGEVCLFAQETAMSWFRDQVIGI